MVDRTLVVCSSAELKLSWRGYYYKGRSPNHFGGRNSFCPFTYTVVFFGGELFEVFGDPTTNGIYTKTETWVMSELENHSSVEH
jgi:hypothetical protein